MKRAPEITVPRGNCWSGCAPRWPCSEARIRPCPFPVPPPLTGLLPDGGWKAGAAYSLEVGGALLLALLAGPSQEGPLVRRGGHAGVRGRGGCGERGVPLERWH
ncbi:MAG: hypothetical protein U0R79_03305 [Propionicimonas sp.]